MDKTFKHRQFFQGRSAKCYTVDDWELWQQTQQSSFYKKKQAKLKEQYKKQSQQIKKKKNRKYLTPEEQDRLFNTIYKQQSKIKSPIRL
jgi:hypothetical protein